jgi:hypothetical protein
MYILRPSTRTGSDMRAEFLSSSLHLVLESGFDERSLTHLENLDDNGRAKFLRWANVHHVQVRVLRKLTLPDNPAARLRGWAEIELRSAEATIEATMACVQAICSELETVGCRPVIMKSLDHWPDIGNDIDLFTEADISLVREVFTQRFDAAPMARSWGDRLARKWNFALPCMAKPIEVHTARLGQTGEHIALAKRFALRRTPKLFGSRQFFVPAAEEQVIAATLQRIYRHFYLRACDVVNIYGLANSGAIELQELRHASDTGGIWNGVATFLRLVSEIAAHYTGSQLALRDQVLADTRFGKERVTVRGGSFQLPVFPEATRLYYDQLMETAFRGDLSAIFRLVSLPPLATAAAVSLAIRGNTKGIW